MRLHHVSYMGASPGSDSGFGIAWLVGGWYAGFSSPRSVEPAGGLLDASFASNSVPRSIYHIVTRGDGRRKIFVSVYQDRWSGTAFIRPGGA